MSETAVQDTRKFFVLPQGYEGGGYYSYGTPSEGRSQYAHPYLISLIGQIAFRWNAGENRKFGVGNISLAGGIRHPDHASHRSGLEVDIRAVRKDGRRLPCNIHDSQYDRSATEKLIQLFLAAMHIRTIYFNDLSISGVRPLRGHDDHFHVELNLNA